MSDYYCTNCGADLGDQSGFDPSCGAWTCTRCGTMLMDDDTFNGDNFEGVAWFCDNCGALLNKQSGFYDGCGSWTCTDCGYSNGITEDDIFESEDSYQKHEYYSSKQRKEEEEEEDNDTEPEIYCPNCGANLRDQWEYNDYCNDYTCDECNANLHRDYSYDEFSVEENRANEDYDYDDDYEYSHNRYSPPPTAQYNRRKKLSDIIKDRAKSYFSTKIPPNRDVIKKRAKAFFFKHKLISVGYSSYYLQGRDADEVYELLYNRGFKRITRIDLKDIYINSPFRENSVAKAEINGISYFESFSEFPYDSNLVITIHQKREITIPFSSSQLRKINYNEVFSRLMHLGFTKIRTSPINDLITGWITKNGSVEKVEINGSNSYKKNTTYKYDVNITIFYHTFK